MITPLNNQPSSLPPRFGGRMLNPTQLMTYAISKARGLNRPLGEFIKMRESPGGDMHTQFIQDTSIFWVPKAACSRSLLELFEVSFVELIESGCFYYFSPLVAGKVFSPLMHKFAGKGFDAKWLAAPLENAPKHLLKSVAPVKLALALVCTGLSVALLYSMNFAKNLITEHHFKKNVFSDVIGLSKGSVKHHEQESALSKKAKRRIWQSALGGVGVVIGSFMLAKWGHKLPQKPVQKLADLFDFKFKAVRDKADKITHYKFDLGRHHLKMILPFDILAYDDATRDHLEFIEVFSRTMVTGNYISWGQPIMEKLWYQWRSKPYRHLGIFEGAKFNSIKDVHTISTMCLQLAETELKKQGKAISATAIKEKAALLFNERLAVKNKLFFGPFLFGILGIGMFTALMNRVWTNYRFHLAERAKKHPLQSPNYIPSSIASPMLSVHYGSTTPERSK